jgi:SNF2 family DNA or RNA helicase
VSEVSPSPCPLITSYTPEWRISENTLSNLFTLRNWDPGHDGPIPFKWPTKLRTHFYSTVYDQVTNIPIELRGYQLQMIHHLARMPRFICGDGVGLGKTPDAVAATCWLHDRYPKTKTIVMATKSTTEQWADEIRRFSTLRPHVLQDKYGKGKGKGKKKSYDARFAQFQDFLEQDSHDVLICKYSSLKGTRRKVEGKFDDEGRPVNQGRELITQEIKQFAKILRPHGERITLILDESHKFKGVGSQVRVMVQMFSQAQCAKRVWAMTATAIKNNLEEFYSIAAAIGIRPFGGMQEFRDDFCIYESVKVNARGQEKEILKGYRNVPRFRNGMRPFFLGRSQAQVKEPLPKLTTVVHPIDLDDEQAKLLLEDIPSGEYKLPPALVKDQEGQWHEKERSFENEMTALAVYRLVANHPALLDPADVASFYTPKLSPKEECLLDLLDGDYRGEKVIVFSSFRMWIDRLEKLTADGKFTERKFLRITGAENEKQRAKAKALFQEPDSGYDVIFINSAAIEGVNLQQASHLICLDAPWSWGDLLQLVGRMVRMASPHAACTLHMLAARGTIDEFAIETLKGKKGLFEAILGESHSAGVLDDKGIYDLNTGMESAPPDEDFHKLMRAHAKSIGLKQFLQGDMLAEAQGDVGTYKMAFEPGAKKRAKKSTRKSQEEIEDELQQLAMRWG